MEIKITGSRELEKMLCRLSKSMEPEKRKEMLAASTDFLRNYLKQLYDRELESSKIKNKLFTESSPEYGKVYTDRPHALFLEYGTRPHDIFPRWKKVLSWYTGPKPRPKGYMSNRKMWAMSSHVIHPGSKGKYFFRRTLEDSEDTVLEIFRRGIDV
jgi:hypothetical protein